jgi:hypothetical protein
MLPIRPPLPGGGGTDILSSWYDFSFACWRQFRWRSP